MAISSPSPSLPAPHREPSTCDELYMQQSISLSESINDLKSLRSQLYSAADYFEMSYGKDCDKREALVDTLKDYAVKALVNTVDHLGSVSSKVDDFLKENVLEVSKADLRISCIEQRILSCRDFIDRAGLSQQSSVIVTPTYHKRYIVPVGEAMPESGRLAVAHSPDLNLKEDNQTRTFEDVVRSTVKERPPSFRKGRFLAPSPSLRGRSSSPSRREQRSQSPSLQPNTFAFTITAEKQSVLPLPNSTPSTTTLLRSGSSSMKPNKLSSFSIARQKFPAETLKSHSMNLYLQAGKIDQRTMDRNPTKPKGFLKSLLRRRKMKKDDVLDTYTYEY